jgi:AraC family transcriptional regulator
MTNERKKNMNCIDDIKLVVDYIENDINNVDMASISKLTGIPGGLYQRIFSYICGISIPEYARRRRLTEAACKILKNSGSIIDIAIEFGYDSHSAFTRAFKEQFGVPPISLTYEIFKEREYRRFSFQEDNDTYYVMKGRRIMAELVKIEYEEMNERMLIGISKTDIGVAEHKLWGVYFEGGYSGKLGELVDYLCEDMTEEYIGIGYATDFKDEKSLGNEYIVGAYFKPGTPVPENMVSKIIPKGTIVKAQVKGKNLNDIINNAYILISDMVHKNGYQLDYDNFYWSEVYTSERYGNPANNGAEELILDWYMPCKKEPLERMKEGKKYEL